jgi:DNA-binding MarR family transcriptional regulator
MDPVYAELLGRVVETYRHSLANAAPARESLAGIGLSNAALLDRFKIGWSEGTLSSMARGEVLERLKDLGLLEADGRERFAGCVVVPAFDESDTVVQIAAYGPDGAVTWLFSEETPVFWNASCLRASRNVLVVPDPLAGMLEIQGGREGVIAPAGPGVPLGQAARDVLVAQGAQVTLRGCEALRPELEKLGVLALPQKTGAHGQVVEQDSNGFAVEFPRRLRFVVQGIRQDSPRHLRASVKAFRRSVDGVDKPRLHLDTLDLFHARSRIGFARTAACLLGEDPTLMEDLLGKIVSLAEEFLTGREKAAPTVVLTESEKAEALELLRDPGYPERVASDLSLLGYVGEEENKQVGYLASLSRKLEDPLSVLVVSRSAAGKSTLAEAVGSLCPQEDLLRFTRLTAQTLYYQKPGALEHKLVLVEEAEGVEDAAYALRVLQSARKLSLSTAAGKGDARTREVKGPVALFVTTTRTDLDEETAGRFVTLSVDESKEQTRAILAAQREAEARPPGEGDRLLRLHQNAQRLLSPVKIVNPHAPHLTFPDERLSARRDHRKYLALIRAVAFARQHQRKVVNGAIEVALEDIALANRLAHHALGQSLYDLTPPSRRLLIELREWLSLRALKDGISVEDLRFTRRELRAHTGWKRTQLEVHLKDLVETEYVLAIAGGGQGRRVAYRLDWDGRGLDGERFYGGLADVGTLAGSLPGTCRVAADKRKVARKGRKDPREADSGPTCRVAGAGQS